MEFEKVVPFKNWSSTDFTGMFGGEKYEFKAGGTYSVPSTFALHFAHQLAVEQLHALGTVKGEMLSEPDVKEYMDKCFPVKSQQPSLASSFERIDEVKDVEAKDAVPMPENKTENIAQQETSEDDENDVTDEKNNAGAPKFKNPVGRPPKSRDAQYVA